MIVSIEKSPGRASSSGATLAPQARHTAKSLEKLSHFYCAATWRSAVSSSCAIICVRG